MRHRRTPSLFLRLLAAALLLGAASGCTPVRDLSEYVVVFVDPGADFEQRLREAMLQARPGTVIELPAGTYAMTDALTVESPWVVVRGQGMNATVLDFSGQARGSQGILATGDHFAIRDLSILDPAGDGVKTQGIEGATFERVRVEWTRGPHPDNGDYGLYPAESYDVLVSGCVIKGSRDAGIYVGQSENVIVRHSFVESNVLGIEIENSINADVYGNIATGNTAGIAVFNLPDLKDGFGTRVFANTIYDNNTPNFAAGGILASVPGGTGIIVIGAKDVEIHDNAIWGNGTTNVVAASFLIAQETIRDPDYDPYIERIAIHDNVFGDTTPGVQGQLGIVVSVVFAERGIPDIAVGGWVDPAKISGFDPALLPWPSQVEAPNRTCVWNNRHTRAGLEFGHMNGFEVQPSVDLYDRSPFDCAHPPRLPVLIPGAPAPPDEDGGLSDAERERLCNLAVPGVNWDATVANCRFLDQYGLFPGGDPREDPAPGGIEYDLTTPLFSDYAEKDRFIFLPPGTAMTYSDAGVFGFPIGTIISKTFSFVDDVSSATPEDVLVETRLLIRREEGWEGLPYIWDESTGRAELAVAGGVRRVRFTDPQGIVQDTEYAIPDMAQCGACHFGADGDVPIGPKARLLNRDLDYDSGTANQLAQLGDLGLLDGAPADPARAPRLPVWDDPSDGTLEERARAYLESNCAHCHNPQGRAGFTSLHLTWDHPLDQMYGLCKRPIAAGSGAGGLQWDIDPGSPDTSILVFRMDSVQPSIMMPELAKSLVHEPGVALVADWIETLSGRCDP